jgi:hypothetical protein
MQAELWAKWVEVERRATKLLLMRRDEGPLLQIMEMPVEGDWICWEFFSTPIGREVYRSVWKRSEDLAKFQAPGFQADHAPAPSVKTRSVSANEAFGEATLAALRDLKVPLFPQHEESDVPGRLVELSLTQPQLNGLFRWHDPGPVDWRPLIEWSAQWRESAAKLFN